MGTQVGGRSRESGMSDKGCSGGLPRPVVEPVKPRETSLGRTPRPSCPYLCFGSGTGCLDVSGNEGETGVEDVEVGVTGGTTRYLCGPSQAGIVETCLPREVDFSGKRSVLGGGVAGHKVLRTRVPTEGTG